MVASRPGPSLRLSSASPLSRQPKHAVWPCPPAFCHLLHGDLPVTLRFHCTAPHRTTAAPNLQPASRSESRQSPPPTFHLSKVRCCALPSLQRAGLGRTAFLLALHICVSEPINTGCCSLPATPQAMSRPWHTRLPSFTVATGRSSGPSLAHSWSKDEFTITSGPRGTWSTVHLHVRTALPYMCISRSTGQCSGTHLTTRRRHFPSRLVSQAVG